MHRQVVLAAVLFVPVLPVGEAASAETVTGALRGVVRTHNGQPLPRPGRRAHRRRSRTLVTGPDGRYEAAGLAPGEYRLEVAGARVRPRARRRGRASWPRRCPSTSSSARRRCASRWWWPPRAARRRFDPRGERHRAGSTSAIESAAELFLPEPAAGGAGSGHGAHRRPGLAGLGVRPRRRVALRARPGGRRARQRAGRALQLRQHRCRSSSSASRWCAARPAASTAPTRWPASSTSSPAAPTPAAKPDLRLTREGGSFGTWQGARPAPGRAGRFDWNAGLSAARDGQRGARTAPSRRRRPPRRWGRRLGDDTTLRFVLRGGRQHAGHARPDRLRPARPRRRLRADGLVVGGLLRHLRGKLAHQISAGFATTDQLSHGPGRLRLLHPALRIPTGALQGLRLRRHPGASRTTRAGSPPATSSRRRRRAAPAHRGRGRRARDGRARVAARRAALADADERGRLRAGPGRARPAGLPDPRRPPRAQRQLRDEGRAAGRHGLAGRETRDDDAEGQRRRGDQGARLLRDLRRLVLRAGQPRPEARAEPHLRRRASSSGSSTAACAPRPRSSTTSTGTRSPSRSWTSTPSRGSYVNLGKTRAQGLELSLEAAPTPPCAPRGLHAASTAR